MTIFKYSGLVVLLFGLSLLGIRAGTDKRPNSLVMASISPPKSFNTVVASETSSTMTLGFIYDGLVDIDPHTNQVVPALAESWEISEDGLTYIFHLRKDVLWNDGHPFTAADVEFTFNDLIYNEDISTSSRDIYTVDRKYFKVRAVDDHTVEFTTAAKFAPFLRMIGTSILPKHSLKPLVDAGVFESSLGVNAKPEDIVGTGPFMLERYIQGQRIILKRNPLYWKHDADGIQLPYLDHIVIEIVQNQDVELLKFKQRELDYYSLRGEDYPLLKPKEESGGFTIHRTGTQTGSQFLFFNQNTGKGKDGKPYVDPVKLKWFRNPRFREAVSYAIDRKSMINILMNGLGVPQWGPMGPSEGLFFNPNVRQYPYNPERARRILAEGGFRDINGDGFLQDPGGNRVSFQLTTNNENTVRVRMAEMICKDLTDIGFEVFFMPLQFNALVSKLDSSFDWEAMILGLTGGPEPHGGRNVWHSSGRLHMWFPRQDKPSTEWEERIDELFELGVQELDERKRKAIYDEWQRIVAEFQPFIYTVLSERVQAVRNGLANVKPSVYVGALHSIEQVYWEDIGKPVREKPQLHTISSRTGQAK